MDDWTRAGALACRNVAERGFAATYAGRDERGRFEITCGDGENHAELEPSELVLTHLKHLVDRDETLRELERLPNGWAASRADAASPWVFQAFNRASENARADAEHDRSPAPKGEDGLDEHERKCVSDVERFGWHGIEVGPGEEDDGFTYTVGIFAALGHPEIVVFGQKPDWRRHVIVALVEAIREGRRFEDGAVTTDVLPGFACRIRAIATPESYDEYLGWALWYHRYQKLPGVPPVVQFVYPDRNGNFPGEAAYRNYRQPLPA